ncbi:MAG: DNA gyrase inhibitor YacG [Planctomycetes bacterium]|nr:DNA gyrase inhibitor YacG [Planctomycetota bacterium]
MAEAVCPICRKKFDPAVSEAPPFCGKRCREIDLGRWLGERYAFPTSRADDEEATDGEIPDSDDQRD